MMEWIAFLVVSGCAIAAAVGLVVRPNPLHGALFLVGTLFCVAVLYLMMEAEFLALAQVIVYAGAIMVLFIFAIMLLIPGKTETGPDPLRTYRRWALPLGGLMGLVVLVSVVQTTGSRPDTRSAAGSVSAIGRLLFTDYLLPFEVTALLLLVALIGALALAKRHPTGS